MLMDSNAIPQRRYDYLPFGSELLANTGNRTTGMRYLAAPDDLGPKFTSQTREPETVLDWFNVRDYSPTQGRFQSVDPGNAGADPSDPQTWNMYAYVTNNPLSYTDPSGMDDEGGCGICGVLTAIGIAIADAFGFEGGGHTPWLANFPFPNQFPGAAPSGGPLGIPGGDSDSAFVLGYTSTQTMPWPDAVPGFPNIWPAINGVGGAIIGALGRVASVGLALILNPMPAGGKDEVIFETTHRLPITYIQTGITFYMPPPKTLPAFPDASRVRGKTPVQGGGGTRARWKSKDGKIIEWDSQHGTVEVYSPGGKHLGEYNPNTGEQTKPAKPGRSVER